MNNELLLENLKFFLNIGEEELFDFAKKFFSRSYDHVLCEDGSYVLAFNAPSNTWIVAHTDTFNSYSNKDKLKDLYDYPYYDYLYYDYSGKPEEKEILVNRVKGKTYVFSSEIFKRYSGQCLGGDDRAGVSMIFSLIEEIGPKDFNVALFSGEELGGYGVERAVSDQANILKRARCFIELDRKGFGEYVLYHSYKRKEILSFLSFLNRFFTRSTGSFSDIFTLTNATKIFSFNLSVGFYNNHSENEYIVFEDYVYTYQKLPLIITELKKYPQLIDPSISSFVYRFSLKQNTNKGTNKDINFAFYYNENPSPMETKQFFDEEV